MIEEAVDLAKKINLEIDSDDVQELQGSHNQVLTIDVLIAMHQQDQVTRTASKIATDSPNFQIQHSVTLVALELKLMT
ncbi:hypothetical protein TNCV_644501 [Trichonephila clavipes]|nr:hypothetical protein TNCV_644501 [Trichonephila clavipes]